MSLCQMWLVLNGVVLLKWDEVTSLSITDWEGNTVFLPITASACMIFSLLAIVKVTPENAQLLCMADLQLDWYGFSQTSNKSS